MTATAAGHAAVHPAARRTTALVLAALIAWLLQRTLPEHILAISDRQALLLHTWLALAALPIASITCWITCIGHSDGPPRGSVWFAAALLGAAMLETARILAAYDPVTRATVSGSDATTVLWLTAHALQAGGLLVASLQGSTAPMHRAGRRLVMTGMLAFTMVTVWLMLDPPHGWPLSLGDHLESFTAAAEWAVVMTLCLAGWRFGLTALEPGRRASVYLAGAAAIAAIAELTLDRTSTGGRAVTGDLLGHGLRLLAYLLIYRAVLLDVVREPMRERARHEAEVREREQQLRRLFEYAPDAILVIDERGIVQYANPQTESVFGHRVETLVGRNINLLMPTSQAARHDAQLSRYLHTGERHIIGVGREVEGRHQDGRTLPIHLTVGEMPFGEGRRFIGFVRDLTERRNAQQEQDRLQRQLMHAQKMDALGQLTGGIAHDFNNMLASILGFTQLSLQRHVPDRDSKLALYLGEVTRVSERGRDLIAKLLAYSRFDSGGQATAQPVAPLVDDAVRMLASGMPAGIGLSTRIEPDLPTVRIAPVDLHQVLMNLVINARDALGDAGRITIEAQARHTDGMVCASCQGRITGDHVSILIGDTGGGIPAELMPRVFEPFFTTKDIGRGTGLGLSMVHAIVHNAGGHVLLRSAADHGTEVELLLPCSATAPPAPPVATADPLPVSQPATGQAAQVWVVDDDEAVGIYLTELLGEQGYRVTRFTDPLAALREFRRQPDIVDIVVTDQKMPKLSGEELAQAMGRLRPQLHIVLCSGHMERLDPQRARAVGIRHLLHKPFDTGQLLRALRGVPEITS